MNNEDKTFKDISFDKISENNIKDSEIDKDSFLKPKDNMIVREDNSLVFENMYEDNRKTRGRKRKKANSSLSLLVAISVAIIWILGTILYFISNENTNNLNSFAILITLLGPAAFSILAGIMSDNLARSNSETRTLINLTKKLLEPEKFSQNAAKSSIANIREEIEKLENTLDIVTNKLGGLENNIEIKTASLRKVSEDAKSGTFELVSNMETERNRLDNLLKTLSELNNSTKSATIIATQGINENAAIMSKAAQNLALQTQEVSTSANAIAEKIDIAVAKTMGAIDDLERASSKSELALDKATQIIFDAKNIATAANSELQNTAIELNTSASNINNIAMQTNRIIQNANEATKNNAQNSIAELKIATDEATKSIFDKLNFEISNAKNITLSHLQELQNASSNISNLSIETSDILNSNLENSKTKIETLRQQSFEISNDAERFTQNRIEDAKRIVNNSTSLLNDAGATVQKRFEEISNICAIQAASVETIIDGLNEKLSKLPQEAAERAMAVESALSATLEKLNETGKKAAEETKALDDAFQARLRESYSALGEVVQRIGGLSGINPPINPVSIERTAPVIQENKIEEKPFEDKEPKFNSILSPSINVRSVKSETKDKPEDLPIEAISKLNLKNINEIEEPKPLNILPNDDPYKDLNYISPLNRNNVSNEWNWKDILSAIDSNDVEVSNIEKYLISELDLRNKIIETSLARIYQATLRNQDKKLNPTKLAYPKLVSDLQGIMNSNSNFRSFIVKFIEERREKSAKNRLSGDELRLYLIGDAALD